MASDRSGQWRHAAEALVIPIAALAAAMAVFGVFMAALGQHPLEIYALIYKGAFANAFSWQNTLSRAAPLILTALCVALPAQAGLMVIGGEGAVVLGGLTAAIVGHLLSVAAPAGVKVSMMLVGMLVRGLLGALAALVPYPRSRCALRTVGATPRAARRGGRPVGALVLTACVLGGAAAGLAGAVEVAAVHGSANASLIAGYGYAGIVVAFIARQNPLAIVPVAVLVGGLSASGGMLQRRLDLPDATVLVLQGIAFMLILGSEALYGRLKPFRARAA